jgi:hypothetical protein
VEEPFLEAGPCLVEGPCLVAGPFLAVPFLVEPYPEVSCLGEEAEHILAAHSHHRPDVATSLAIK